MRIHIADKDKGCNCALVVTTIAVAMWYMLFFGLISSLGQILICLVGDVHLTVCWRVKKVLGLVE
jgi:hypothetical protein